MGSICWTSEAKAIKTATSAVAGAWLVLAGVEQGGGVMQYRGIGLDELRG